MNYPIRKYVVLIFGLACLTACQDELWQNGSADGHVKILARMRPSATTRTCVDGTATDGTVGILWTPGDNIGVYGTNGTTNAVFASTNTSAAPEAVFSGNLKAGETPAYAYYPYNADNASTDESAIKGDLKLVQTYNTTDGRLEADYKVGKPISTSADGGQYEFSFEHLFSLIKFSVNATDTDLEGDNLESIILTLPDGRKLGGEFTFDATTRAVTWTGSEAGANMLTMKWSNTPALTSGQEQTGYMTCAPDIHQGDEIKITILTHQYKAEFTRPALTDFMVNTCYTFPLTLANYHDMVVTKRPVFNHFSFEVNANEGKLLGTKLVYENGKTQPVVNTAEVMTVGTDSVTGCIPYLHDFNLKPTFTIPEGMTITVDGKAQTSGEDEHDFSKPVTYVISNGEENRTYIVRVTNSGLPVVVLTQSDGGTVNWDEAGLKIRAKDADWVETDKMAVYNADGSVDMAEADCGFRLRGNTTQEYPKKPFAIKLASKAKVLGMPKHKRWVLLANWMDRTMLRNAVAFEMAHQAEAALPDGLAWNPHGRNVELVINGRHVGNYYLCEQIKIDGDRVNIRDCYEDVLENNPNPTAEDCGYLLEFDDNYDEVRKFRTSHRYLPCMFKDKVPDNSVYLNYVKNKVQGIEDNLVNGNYAAAYNDLDINSVIDYFYMQELIMNSEYKHPKSIYMYIDGPGKLTAGPIWDFDWQTFALSENVDKLTQKYYGQSGDCRSRFEWLYSDSKLWKATDLDFVYKKDRPYMWYPLLFRDASFREVAQERWSRLYPALLTILSKIDELAEQNRVSETFNSAMWPLIPYHQANRSPSFNGDEDMTFEQAIQSMKKAYTDRLNWMNTQIVNGNFVTDAK